MSTTYWILWQTTMNPANRSRCGEPMSFGEFGFIVLFSLVVLALIYFGSSIWIRIGWKIDDIKRRRQLRRSNRLPK